MTLRIMKNKSLTRAVIDVNIVSEIIRVVPSSYPNIAAKRCLLESWSRVFCIASVFHGGLSDMKKKALLRVH